jgi:hypothetical protein
LDAEAALVVRHVDLDDEATLERIAEHLSDLAWASADGLVTATLVIDATRDAACSVVDAAHRISHVLTDAHVERVHEELVSVSDIAQRTGFSREAVRLWTKGGRGPGDFPPPRACVGGGQRGPTRVWGWAEVSAWLVSTYKLELKPRQLTMTELAAVNAELSHAPQAMDREWQDVTMFNTAVAHAAHLPSLPANVPIRGEWAALPAPQDGLPYTHKKGVVVQRIMGSLTL